VLEELFARALSDAALREKNLSKPTLEKRIRDIPPPPDVYKVLKPIDRIRLIAEIKRASPSKGYLADISDAAELAVGYQFAGADAISVLTEPSEFRGTVRDLEQVAAAVTIPVLRKDFISSEYQILESRAAGASFILLILSFLKSGQARDLMMFAKTLNLGVLVEVHSEVELELALGLGAKLIGINTRDLRTFETDPSLFEELVSLLPEDVVKVAESAVKTIDDVRRYRHFGADVVLVGEALVTGAWRRLIPEIVSVT
jgi:indole-3-glycerol phosphate synthase